MIKKDYRMYTIVFAFILTTAICILTASTVSATAHSDPYILNVTIDDEHINFAGHKESKVNGNWIVVEGGESFKLPSPINLTYKGINTKSFTLNGNDVNINLNASEYTITYPFKEHPMFIDVPGKNDVNLSFYGSTDFANEDVDIYILKLTRSNITNLYNDAKEASTTGFRNILENAYTKSLNNSLNGLGDVEGIIFNDVEAGDYCALVMLNSTGPQSKDLSILSATAFEVLEYKSNINTSSSIQSGDNLNVDVELMDAPDTDTYTYAAVLIRDDVYKAEMVLSSNGTKVGTNFTLNGESILEGFDLVGLDHSNINANDVQNKIKSLIGENNGTVLIKTVNSNQTSLSLTTQDLVEDNYYLIVGAYRSGDYIVACDQMEINISPSSGENPGNIETVESISMDVISGVHTKCELSENGYIDCMEFDPLISADNVGLTVIVLKDRSVLVTSTPGGIIYKYINTHLSEIELEEPRNINNGVIEFRVNASWIEQNNIGLSTIKLKRFENNGWTNLETTIIGIDDDYIYLSAKTPGLSCFSITGQIKSDLGFEPWDYDTDFSGTIEKKEAIEAIKNYFNDMITKDEVLEVIKLCLMS